ncbi:hypothetical protein [Nostoc sp. ATCC 53789]|nr:hypothetical protein [Nostoc sp. ATCC 53789]MBD2513248.1 hypothetical protein [Desmonostoc muscorum FACHB-395]QHG20620.1 hypothetical protein GJB62_32580 [Nostoc sp. ATCC 53789]
MPTKVTVKVLLKAYVCLSLLPAELKAMPAASYAGADNPTNPIIMKF